MSVLRVALNVVVGRWFAAIALVWQHRRTLRYMAGKGWWRSLRRWVFVAFFVRGEDCGKGVLDWVWKLTGWAPYLWDLEVEVTTRCYLKCVHCEHTHFPTAYLNQDLTLRQYEALLDSAPNLKWVNLTGEGSPFLNDQFMAMVRETKRRGIYLDFSHDFAHVRGDDMLQLVEWGVERVYWSLDAATAATYERIRVGANFEETIDDVRVLLETKDEQHSPLPEVCVRWAFFSENVHELPLLIPLLESIAPAHMWGDRPAVNIVALLEFEQTKHMVCEVSPETVATVNRQARKAGWQVYWSHTTHDEAAKPPLAWCTFWSEPYVMVDGNVVPCCGVLMSNARDKLAANAFGNINEASLADIWRRPYYRAFRSMVGNPVAPVPVQCSGCRVFNTQARAAKHGVAE